MATYSYLSEAWAGDSKVQTKSPLCALLDQDDDIFTAYMSDAPPKMNTDNKKDDDVLGFNLQPSFLLDTASEVNTTKTSNPAKPPIAQRILETFSPPSSARDNIVYELALFLLSGIMFIFLLEQVAKLAATVAHV